MSGYGMPSSNARYERSERPSNRPVTADNDLVYRSVAASGFNFAIEDLRIWRALDL